MPPSQCDDDLSGYLSCQAPATLTLHTVHAVCECARHNVCVVCGHVCIIRAPFCTRIRCQLGCLLCDANTNTKRSVRSVGRSDGGGGVGHKAMGAREHTANTIREHAQGHFSRIAPSTITNGFLAAGSMGNISDGLIRIELVLFAQYITSDSLR